MTFRHRSAGTEGRAEVRSADANTPDRVELRYEPGRTEIEAPVHCTDSA